MVRGPTRDLLHRHDANTSEKVAISWFTVQRWLILIDSLDGYPFVCLLICQIISKAEEILLKKAQNNWVQKIDNYVYFQTN